MRAGRKAPSLDMINKNSTNLTQSLVAAKAWAARVKTIRRKALKAKGRNKPELDPNLSKVP